MTRHKQEKEKQVHFPPKTVSNKQDSRIANGKITYEHYLKTKGFKRKNIRILTNMQIK